MHPVPVRWVSVSAQQALVASAREVISAWASGWGLPEPEFGAALAVRMNDAGEALLAMQGLQGVPTGMAYFNVEPASDKAWIQALFGTDLNKGSLLADEVISEAQQGLNAALAQAFGAPMGNSLTARSLEGKLPGHWGVIVSWRCGPLSGRIALAWELMHARNWITQPATAQLPPWQADLVLAGLPLSLTVELGSAEISVTALAELEIGDVVVLARSADHPMRMRAEDCDLEVHAHLVAENNHRAVQVVVRKGLETC